ncbi:GerAB/ArcD/ProY family transporter [Fictibacillus phosphorivorans]|uniref:GerAB/ArcD/ProY family transporter n=1 Tax=Fictibacillus phosphorivorans TaxID=1221500 RepID=UPI00203D8E16|nr:GerAB/ArcD/ProY family transporter [Fictibacillus phosphorivorans]MCM3717792.1 spore germination protein [Fictibacillus phosphorivorans]MCM3777020.1 spore germination protein [Fictibacillus phosphorivorans]
MLSNKNLFFLIIQAQVGIGILGLPYILYNDVQQDGWMSLLVAGVLAQGILIILVALSRTSPKETFYELNHRLLGTFLGKIVNILYILYFISFSLLLMILVSDVINTWILHRTPKWAIILLLLIATTYIAKEQILTISRTFLFFSILFIGLIILLFMVYPQDNHFGRMLPMGSKDFTEIVKASPDAFVSLIGFEIILFIMPFIKNPKKSLLVLTFANLFTVLLYVFLFITCVITFSGAQFSLIQEPLLYLFRGLSFHFVERIDIIFLSFWIVPISTTLVVQLYNASLGVQNLFAIQRNKCVYLLAGILLGLCLLPVSYSIKESLSSFMIYLNIIFVFIFPALLLIIAKVRGIKA